MAVRHSIENQSEYVSFLLGTRPEFFCIKIPTYRETPHRLPASGHAESGFQENGRYVQQSIAP